MQLIGLPGRNPETEAWMATLLESLQVGHTEATVARYLHWAQDIDVDIQREAGQLAFSQADFVVAKSLGTLIALACAESRGYPGQIVFIGTPLRGYADEQRLLLQQLDSHTRALFIQQTADFTGTCAELKALLPPSQALIEVPGSDHVYADVDALASIINRWAGR